MCAVKKTPKSSVAPSTRYINRELSWLKFNTRVLAEAENQDNPLLERLKFLAIFESNLDEFYMVRVSGLIEQETAGLTSRTPDGLIPAQQLAEIANVVPSLRQRATDLLTRTLIPSLAKEGIVLHVCKSLAKTERKNLRSYFEKSVFPLCTPLMLEPANTFPFISNRSLNLAVQLRDQGTPKLARVKIPPNLPRLVKIPGRTTEFVFIEDVIADNLDLLFPGVKTGQCHSFRVIRDADIEIREIDAADLISAVEQSLTLRRFGDPVLLEHEASLDESWVKILQNALVLDNPDTVAVNGFIGFEALWEIYALDRPDLKFRPFVPQLPATLSNSESIFSAIRKSDILLHHPFDSFRPVEEFIASAAEDPLVVGIKMTLYRVGAESPVVESLLRAAKAGKQVAAMVELKARFDESNNLVWSRALERAGVHVTYGFPDMKVHCKLCLVVRQEKSGVRTYAHLGTGNYNPQTALAYTDIGLLTCDPQVCKDVTEMFNFLTGLSRQSKYRKLLVAPLNLREGIIERIEREVAIHKKHKKGRIVFKLNSLVDPEVIDALYEASEAGVEVKLAIRGICCLRPGVEGMSKNIQVVSIVGRFLEHSRVYYFENDGKPEAWIGSADMMRRNLDRRIETLVPLSEPTQIAYIRDAVLLPHFQDNTKSWRLGSDGEYKPYRQGQPFNFQESFLR